MAATMSPACMLKSSCSTRTGHSLPCPLSARPTLYFVYRRHENTPAHTKNSRGCTDRNTLGSEVQALPRPPAAAAASNVITSTTPRPVSTLSAQALCALTLLLAVLHLSLGGPRWERTANGQIGVFHTGILTNYLENQPPPQKSQKQVNNENTRIPFSLNTFVPSRFSAVSTVRDTRAQHMRLSAAA